jgi:hypothetical protein
MSKRTYTIYWITSLILTIVLTILLLDMPTNEILNLDLKVVRFGLLVIINDIICICIGIIHLVDGFVEKNSDLDF